MMNCHQWPLSGHWAVAMQIGAYRMFSGTTMNNSGVGDPGTRRVVIRTNNKWVEYD